MQYTSAVVQLELDHTKLCLDVHMDLVLDVKSINYSEWEVNNSMVHSVWL